MHRIWITAIAATTTLACAEPRGTAGDAAAVEAAAKAVVQQFVGQLKPQLQQAIAEGGPGRATAVCANIAPALMDELSASSGWSVRRVSLQPRNRERAVPDAWEQEVLERFSAEQAAGTPAQALNYGRKVDGQYRYMQAQGVEPVCLMCHGTDLAEPVKKALAAYYPEDSATGYSLGEVRGAISLIDLR
ncbi:DUF3365 domain-containing protein [Haliea sp. E1-2-M8]|uniref:Tll0287-like domain-containing protein n=1 Tax=Haliea sp. E1-2-M8 TaxID=3064706 RepID=UPI002721DDB1|nr:DUF3365 domain-containing protein [Haliea sp. E1-2-M8]MDO8860846.1 DUF3365 domain-containing protein [Haliea sp. E1-2-M8]